MGADKSLKSTKLIESLNAKTLLDSMQSISLIECFKDCLKNKRNTGYKIYVYKDEFVAIYAGIGDFRGFFNKKSLNKNDKMRLDNIPNLINNNNFLNARGFRALLLGMADIDFVDSIDSMGSSSLSHSKNIVTYAFSNKRVGVDVESIKPRLYNHIMDFCFSEDEKRYVQNAPKDKALEEFYRIYTLKEALIKIFGLDFSAISSVGLHSLKTNSNMCAYTAQIPHNTSNKKTAMLTLVMLS